MIVATPETGNIKFSRVISASLCGYEGDQCRYRILPINKDEGITFVTFRYRNTENEGKYGLCCLYCFKVGLAEYAWYSGAYSRDKPWVFDTEEEAIAHAFDVDLFQYGSVGTIVGTVERVEPYEAPIEPAEEHRLIEHILRDLVRIKYSVPSVPHP